MYLADPTEENIIEFRSICHCTRDNGTSRSIMPQNQPDATVTAVFDSGYQTLLDDVTESNMIWDPRVELPDDAPVKTAITQFYHGWETHLATERLTYIIPISGGARTAAHLQNESPDSGCLDRIQRSDAMRHDANSRVVQKYLQRTRKVRVL